MKVVEEVYPGGSKTSDHNPLIDSIGTVLLKTLNPNNSQNGWMIFQDGAAYGYLVYGWDTRFCELPITRCKDYQGLDTLRATLKENTKWGTKIELAEFFERNDWVIDYGWQFQEFRNFVEAAKLALK